MKRISFIIVALLTSVSTTWLFSQVLDVPVAKVELYKVDIITQRELRHDIDMLSQQLRQQVPVTQRKQILEAKIGEVLITQAADHDKMQVTQDEVNKAIQQKKAQMEQAAHSQLSDAQFQQLIEQQGVTWSDYRDQLKKQLLEEKYIRKVEASYFTNLHEPTDSEIQQVYDNNATSFTNPAMIRFDYIATDIRNADAKQKEAARKKIDELYQEIRTGQATFDQLKNKSVDDPSFTGGDFGYLVRSDPRTVGILGQSFVDSVFELKNGEVSKVIPSNVGYYICHVTDKRSAKILTLDDPIAPGAQITVKDRIREYLMAQTQQKAFSDAAKHLIDSLKAKADIQIYEEQLNW